MWNINEFREFLCAFLQRCGCVFHWRFGLPRLVSIYTRCICRLRRATLGQFRHDRKDRVSPMCFSRSRGPLSESRVWRRSEDATATTTLPNASEENGNPNSLIDVASNRPGVGAQIVFKRLLMTH